jgi:hypothetical protein
MIGMEMGEQNRIDPPHLKTHERHIARRTVPGIDHVETLSGDNEDARPSPRGIRHGATGAAETDVKTVRLFFGKVGRNSLIDDPFRKDETDLSLE